MSGKRDAAVGKLDRLALLNLLEDLKAENEARKRTEKDLREAEARFRLLFEHSPDGIVILDPATARPLEFNETACRQLGYSREEFARLAISDYEASETAEETFARIARVLREGRNDFETRHRTKEGEVRDIHVTAQVTEILGKAVYHCVWRDITERKRAEAKLRDSEETMRYIVKHDPNAIAVYDHDLHYIAVSDRYLQDYGVKGEDIIGKHHYEVFPEMPQRWKDVHQRCLAGAIERDDDDFFERPDGSITYNRWECRPWRRADGEIGGIITYTEVTTERKKAEKALRDSEEKFKAVFESANVGKSITLPSGEIYVNRAFADMLGYEWGELKVKRWQDLTPEDEIAPIQDRLDRLLAGEEDATRFAKSYIRKDGGLVWGDVSVKIRRDGEGRPIDFITTVVDITERKKAEEILRESDVRLNKLVTWVPGMIYRFKRRPDGSYCVPFTTEAIRGIFDCSPEDVREDFAPIARIIVPEDFDRVVSSIEESAERLTAWACEYRVQIAGRPVRWMLGTATPERSDDGSITWYGYNMDITERKEMDEAVRSSLREKETLLREIHHRVKNNMQVISSLFNLQAGHIADEDARRMLKEGQLRIRSMALIHEKLYQARDLSKIEFASYLQSLATHLFQFFKVDPKQVRLETDLEDVPLDINTAVPSGLLVNELISNALKHAFPGGRKGTVWIKLRRQKDRSLMLRVADDGIGFPKGLDFQRTESFGLQIVDLLIGQLEGKIKLDRTKGTDFAITFRELEYKPRT